MTSSIFGQRAMVMKPNMLHKDSFIFSTRMSIMRVFKIGNFFKRSPTNSLVAQFEMIRCNIIDLSIDTPKEFLYF